MKYEPARGSAAAVCWILIVGCSLVSILSLAGWIQAANEAFPAVQTLLPLLVILGAIARLRGWAPTPKGI